MTPRLRLLSCAAVALSLAACGGGDTATVGGTLGGLNTGSTVVLQNNATNNLTLSANGSFIFPGGQASNSAYNVSVLTQPVGETCSVVNGSGSIDSSNDLVTNVSVSCAVTASVGGTVTGLTAGTSVTLSNAGVTLPVAANGTFAFPGTISAGTAYDVTIVTQPAGLTCTIANPSGTVTANTTANVSVVCA